MSTAVCLVAKLGHLRLGQGFCNSPQRIGHESWPSKMFVGWDLKLAAQATCWRAAWRKSWRLHHGNFNFGNEVGAFLDENSPTLTRTIAKSKSLWTFDHISGNDKPFCPWMIAGKWTAKVEFQWFLISEWLSQQSNQPLKVRKVFFSFFSLRVQWTGIQMLVFQCES